MRAIERENAEITLTYQSNMNDFYGGKMVIEYLKHIWFIVSHKFCTFSFVISKI